MFVLVCVCVSRSELGVEKVKDLDRMQFTVAPVTVVIPVPFLSSKEGLTMEPGVVPAGSRTAWLNSAL